MIYLHHIQWPSEMSSKPPSKEKEMSLVETLKSMAHGVPYGIALITVLPVFGPVGVITAAGVAVGSTIGAAAGLADQINKSGTQ